VFRVVIVGFSVLLNGQRYMVGLFKMKVVPFDPEELGVVMFEPPARQHLSIVESALLDPLSRQE
jgi:hypothetical protein